MLDLFPFPLVLHAPLLPSDLCLLQYLRVATSEANEALKIEKNINLRLIAFTRAIFIVVEDIQSTHTLSLLVQSTGNVKSITCLATHMHKRKPVTAD